MNTPEVINQFISQMVTCYGSEWGYIDRHPFYWVQLRQTTSFLALYSVHLFPKEAGITKFKITKKGTDRNVDDDYDGFVCGPEIHKIFYNDETWFDFEDAVIRYSGSDIEKNLFIYAKEKLIHATPPQVSSFVFDDWFNSDNDILQFDDYWTINI
jgi:hypothetical protein